MQIGDNLQTPGMKLKCPSVPKQHLQLPRAREESLEQHPHPQPHRTWRPTFSSSLSPSCSVLQIFLRTTRFLRSLRLSISPWGRQCRGLAVPVFSSNSHAARDSQPSFPRTRIRSGEPLAHGDLISQRSPRRMVRALLALHRGG